MAVNKMDWQKNILIAGILAVLFVLAIRWNSYQEKHPAVPTTLTAVQTDSASSSTSSAKNSDIPTVTPAPGTTETPVAELAPVSTALIKVATDSLIVDINPRGGDIVKVALPRHSAELSTPDVPFVLIDNTADHTYIAQSGLVGVNGTDTADGGRPLFSVQKNEYTLENGQDTLVVDLTFQQHQINITKRYTFARGQYLIGVEYIIDNQSGNKWNGNLYAQIKRDNKKFAKTNVLAMNPFLGAAITTPTEKYKKITFDEIDKIDDVKKLEVTEQGGWVSLVQHYFISAWIPDSKSTNTFSFLKDNNNLYIFRFISNAVEVLPNSKSSIKANFYAGPKDAENLEKISPHLELTVDYGKLWMISQPLFELMKFIQPYLFNNWGLAIIVLTFIVKAIFFKLSATSYRSMAKMRKLAPKMLELKERYGNDRQKMSQETMKLYQTEKVNPLGGCLPMLIQMPVFLALYWVLMESVELRHAPFFLWIQDLSVKDPYYVLPIIYGITMWFMQKLNPQPTDPMQARVMQMLPIVFTFMFLLFPAGLVLYWVTNNTLSMLQQYVITKQIDNADNKAKD